MIPYNDIIMKLLQTPFSHLYQNKKREIFNNS
jgi:hypothetical protein